MIAVTAATRRRRGTMTAAAMFAATMPVGGLVRDWGRGCRDMLRMVAAAMSIFMMESGRWGAAMGIAAVEMIIIMVMLMADRDHDIQ
jgi:hypothetical protein